ncbi:alpha/beta fold hydrolase [Actinoplanes sp. GCM10030250]|uniref:alpha/beta fold hydrolase n=1 Tax=Actinoplanes sp. GCM10030250 TaxID=3273376 RepID=UPI003606E992
MTRSLQSRTVFAVEAVAARHSAAPGAWAWLVVASSGVVAAALVPRGPVTGGAVIALLVGAAIVGAVSGLLIRTRWVLIAAPALHIALWELSRATIFRLDGAAFGRPRFDVPLGVALFLTVHLMYALIVAMPMLIGVLGGRAWARRRGAAVAAGGVAFLAVMAAGVVLVWPSRVAPVRGVDGTTPAGSVATLEAVRLGGTPQWVSMRGSSAANPVLLHLSGGPGSSDVGWVRTFNQPLEQHFTVVVWEQRGGGKSYPALDPTSRLTPDQLVSDGIELSAWLAERFDERKIYLSGNSWGSTLGVLMVQRRPDLFHAYIGTGQMVSQRETDRLLYRQLNAYAARNGDERLRDELAALGEPPYRDVFGYALVMEYYDALEPYEHEPAFDEARGLRGFFPDEYSLLDTWNEVRGFADMGGVLYPRLQGIDFRINVPVLEVPVYFAQGRHELTARGTLADEWIAQLRAPIKRTYVFQRSGHNPDAEEPGRFNRLLTDTVLAETYPR